MNEYNPEEPSTFKTYLDKNHFYCWAMSEYLPYKKLELVKNVDEPDVMSINKK